MKCCIREKFNLAGICKSKQKAGVSQVSDHLYDFDSTVISVSK